MSLVDMCAAAGLVGMIAYAILGGADFGGGVWDLLASGPRKDAQRAAIARAMGPVWEANHVWLIFVVVVFFSAFPVAWAAYATALFTPLRIVLAGIGLRGVAFVFRSYTGKTPAVARWGAAFGAASLITPFLLGACVGAISSGAIRFHDGQLVVTGRPWLSPIALAMGAAGASLCAYLAAVFLTVETEGELQEDFRRRALIAGTIVVAGAALTVPFTFLESPHLAHGLMSGSALPVVIAGTIAALLSGWSLRARRYRIARLATVVQVVMVISGWAIAQYPYLIYPDVTLAQAAAPRATMLFLLGSLPFGLAIVGPSLWWLFKVFKGEAAKLA
ncbi:MAG: cytochrome d ubiquinol oxidase subunit II [Polyangiales bacterium]